MDEVTNPFAPGAGTRPPELVGREGILNEAKTAFARIRAGRAARSFLLVGLRGVGKTVLLNRLEETAQQEGFKTIAVEAPEGRRLPELLIPPLRSLLVSLSLSEALTRHGQRAVRLVKNFAAAFKVKIGEFEVGVTPSQGEADSGDLETDLTELLLAIAEAAKERGTPVAILIDEMQYLNEEELSALIMAVHKLGQKGLPLLVVGAGLPQLIGLCGKAKSYTERLFQFPSIGALGEFDAKNAVRIPARDKNVLFQPDALYEIVRVTKGYPYFLQEWGYHVWNLATKSPITLGVVRKASDAVTKHLDANFFQVRYDRLTPREREYLRAMAELGSGPHRSGDIADMLQVPVRTIAPVRGHLIKKGMVFSPAHGDTAFTVPLFDEFMKRIIPGFQRSKPARHVTPE